MMHSGELRSLTKQYDASCRVRLRGGTDEKICIFETELEICLAFLSEAQLGLNNERNSR